MSSSSRNDAGRTPVRVARVKRNGFPRTLPRENGTSENLQLAPGAPSGRHKKIPRILFVTDFYLEEMLVGAAGYAHCAGWELNSNMRFHGLLPRETEADGILATVTRESKVRDWLAGWKCPIVRMMTS